MEKREQCFTKKDFLEALYIYIYIDYIECICGKSSNFGRNLNNGQHQLHGDSEG